jgi:hypothetical protein
MANKKFQFKGSTAKTAKVEPEVQQPTQPDMATLLSQLIDQKLAALVSAAPTPTAAPVAPPVVDEDFTLLEETKEVVKTEDKKPKLPKTTKEKPKIEIRKLVIEDTEQRASFEQAITEFNKARSVQNEAKKEVEEGRKVILEAMGDNLLYEGDSLNLSIKNAKNESVSPEAVFAALVDMDCQDIKEIKEGVQQILDLARLGIITINKGNFERWVKGHGYDSKPFIVEHEAEKRISVTPKQ